MHPSKRKICFALLLLSCLLVACTKSDPILQPQSFPAPTERPPVLTVQIEYPTPSPTPEPPPFSLAPYQLSETEAVYDILPLLQRDGKTLLHAGFSDKDELTVLYASSNLDMLFLHRFNLSTGVETELYTDLLPEPLLYSDQMQCFSMTPPLFWDGQTQTLYLFTPDGKHRTRKNVTDRNFYLYGCFGFAGGAIALDGMQNTLYSIGFDGEEKPLFQFDYRYSYPELLSVSEDGHTAVFHVTDNRDFERKTVAVDLTTGEFIGCALRDVYLCESEHGLSTLSYTNDWSETEGEKSCITLKKADNFDSSEIFAAEWTKTEYYPSVIPVQNGFLVESYDNNYTLRYFDPVHTSVSTLSMAALYQNERYTSLVEAKWAETGEAESAFLFPKTYCDATDGSYVLTHVQIDNETVGLLLTSLAAAETEPLSGMTYSEPLFSPLSAPEPDYGVFAERVRRIQDQYGVTVLLGRDAQLCLYTHKADLFPLTGAESDPVRLDEVLTQIEAVLAEYPPHFLEILCENHLDGIVLEICGTIRSLSSGSLDYPAAVTGTLGQWRLIMLDVAYLSEVRYTLFHEIAHMIDGKLDYLSLPVDVWGENSWNTLNPSDFQYYYAYVDGKGNSYELSGSDTYTLSDKTYLKKGRTDRVYYLMKYAKTYPTEDRAVLLGTLLADELQDEYLAYPHLLAKLTYYSRAIRMGFDPDGTLWPEPTVWEKRIETLQNR